MEHLVDFEKYCGRCVNRDKAENQEPCDDCLEVSAKEDSRKPVHFVERRGGSGGDTVVKPVNSGVQGDLPEAGEEGN